MPWVNDRFYYTVSILEKIARDYVLIYEGLELRDKITDPFLLAEYKADFDMALNSLSARRRLSPVWNGNVDDLKFKDFKFFSRLQRVIIANIFNIEDSEMEQLGFYNIPRLRGYSFYLMKTHLNGGKNAFKK